MELFAGQNGAPSGTGVMSRRIPLRAADMGDRARCEDRAKSGTLSKEAAGRSGFHARKCRAIVGHFPGASGLRLFLITSLTMIAFAANSVFARLALGAGAIDPAGYSLARLASGAIMLALLVLRARKGDIGSLINEGNWASAAALFSYAAAFSFAYVVLHTGTGALILFACVQGTMIGWGLLRGDRPMPLEWLGLAVAFGAFAWLVSPGLAGPDPVGAALMAISGMAWGIYSLRGKSASDPLSATAGNFVRSVPIAIGLAAMFLASMQVTPFGLLMAVLSGAVTSGLGYALWYQALRGLTATQGAIVQLTVPAIAAAGGIVLLGEPLTLRFAVCSVLILGGVAIAILARKYRVLPAGARKDVKMTRGRPHIRP